jgi:predicted HicB family RNase H-like nuclease
MRTKKQPCFSDDHPNCKGTLHPVTVHQTVKTESGSRAEIELELLECDTCKDRFYPSEAMKKISAYKKYSGKFVLRVDPTLHAELANAANKHHRSLNQEVSHLLEEALH